MAADLPAVHAGHHDVQQDEVRTPGFKQTQRLHAVPRLQGFIPLDVQIISDDAAHADFIVRDKNGF